MKTHTTTALLAGCLAIGMSLSSCVVPPSGGSTSITYRTGQRINYLPGGYRTEVIYGNTYYYHNGYYYRPHSGGYIIVDAPRSSRYYGDYQQVHHHVDYRGPNVYRNQNVHVVSHLPSGYRVVTRRGTTYYQSGGQYYRRQGNGYVVVGNPR